MGQVQFFGLTTGQLWTLAGIGVTLLVALFIFARTLKLTQTLVKLGCLAIVILVAIVFIVLWVVGN